MNRISGIALGVALALLLSGCRPGPKSARGFRLPEGDPVAARAAFIANDCVRCHYVHGDQLPRPETMDQDIRVTLGGEVVRVKTYGQLVTSIINPSHIVKREYQQKYTDAEGNSMMPDLTKELTVREMIDIVQYLQGHYELTLPKHVYDYGYNTL